MQHKQQWEGEGEDDDAEGVLQHQKRICERSPRHTVLEASGRNLLWTLAVGVPIVLVLLHALCFNHIPSMKSLRVAIPSDNGRHFNVSILDHYGVVSYLKYSVISCVQLPHRLEGPSGSLSSQLPVAFVALAARVSGPASSPVVPPSALGAKPVINGLTHPPLFSSSLPLHSLRTSPGNAPDRHAQPHSSANSLYFAVGGLTLRGPDARTSLPRTILIEGELVVNEPGGECDDQYPASILFEFASSQYYILTVVLRLVLCVVTALWAWALHRQHPHEVAIDGADKAQLPEQAYCSALLASLFLWLNPVAPLRTMCIALPGAATGSDILHVLIAFEEIVGSIGLVGILFSLVLLFSGIGYPAEWAMKRTARSDVSLSEAAGIIEGERGRLWGDKNGTGLRASYGGVSSSSAAPPAPLRSDGIALCPHDPESPLFFDFIWARLPWLFAICIFVLVKTCFDYFGFLHPSPSGATSSMLAFLLYLFDIVYLFVIIAMIWALYRAFSTSVRRFEGDVSVSGSPASVGGRHVRERDPGALYSALAIRLLKFHIGTFVLLACGYCLCRLYSLNVSNICASSVDAPSRAICVPLAWNSLLDIVAIRWTAVNLLVSMKPFLITICVVSEFVFIIQFAFLQDTYVYLSPKLFSEHVFATQGHLLGKKRSDEFDVELACFLLECSWQTYFVNKGTIQGCLSNRNPFNDSDDDERDAILPPYADGTSFRDLDHLGLAVEYEIHSKVLDLHTFIAVDKARKRIVIAFRGTTGLHNVATDLTLSQVNLPDLKLPLKLSESNSRSKIKSSLVRKIIDWFVKWRDRLEQNYPDEIVCNHEFGLFDVITNDDIKGAVSTANLTTAASDEVGDYCPSVMSPRVHSGFWNAYSLVRLEIYKGIYKVMRKFCFLDVESGADDLGSWDIYVTGHSLGGALATIASLDLTINLKALLEASGILQNGHLPNLELFTFGSPRVGNLDFKVLFEKMVKKSFRIEVNGDLVCRVPALMGYRHAANFPVFICDAINHPDSGAPNNSTSAYTEESEGLASSNISWFSGSNSWASYSSICVINPTYAQFWLLRKHTGHPNYHSLLSYRNYLESLLSDRQKATYFANYYAKRQAIDPNEVSSSIVGGESRASRDSSSARRVSYLVKEFGSLK